MAAPTPATITPGGRSPPVERLHWIPIRPLAPRHRPRILAHLLALDVHDRYLRFGHPASDAQIGRYVDLIDFDRDEVFGVFNRRLELVAMAHLAYLPATPDGNHDAEFGVSTLARARGRGVGSRLFDRAVLHARNRGVRRMIVHALSENAAMLRIARAAGGVVVRNGGDSEAVLVLEPDNAVSHVEALVERRAAEIDYQLKRDVRRLGQLADLVAEVRGRLGGQGPQG